VTWLWLALLDPDAATTSPPALTAEVEGEARRRLVAWAPGGRPHPEAVRVAAEVVDPAGAAATVVWQWFPHGAAPLFDDPAVQQLARRLAGRDVAGVQPDALSTATRDALHYAGGLTVHRDGRPASHVLRDSWLRRVGPARVLRVGPGLLGATAPRPGPGTQRYGGQPWPATRFPT